MFGSIGVYAAIKLQASEVSYNGTTVEEALNELRGDLSEYNYVTVNTESDILLNKPIVAKKVLLTKDSNGAVYEFKCLGYTIN